MAVDALTETQKSIRDAVLAAFPDEWDKTEGSVFWNIASAGAVPAGNKLDELDAALEHEDERTYEGDELTAFCRIFGVDRDMPLSATAFIKITLMQDVKEATIDDGTLFETEDGIQFSADEEYTVQNGDLIEVSAVSEGISGNVDADTITVIPIAIDGVESITNPLMATGGRDEETDSDLFLRWQLRVNGKLDGYSKDWYEYQALKADISSPVEQAVCYAAGEAVTGIPSELGTSGYVPAGWVLLVCLSEGMSEMNENSVAALQEIIDPGKLGFGDGAAPPSARVFCMSAKISNQNITISGLKIENGYNEVSVKNMIQENLIETFWQNAEIGKTLSRGTIFRTLMNIDGVADISDLRIEGSVNSVQKAMLGDIKYE